MKSPALLFGSLVLGAMLCYSPPLGAQSDSCALLKPADLTPFLGGPMMAKNHGGACSWTAVGSTRKLIAVAKAGSGPAAQMAFAGARQAAGKGGASSVTDEAGIGDKALRPVARKVIAAF